MSAVVAPAADGPDLQATVFVSRALAITMKSKPEALSTRRFLPFFFLVFLLAGYARFPDFPQPYFWLDEAWRVHSIVSTRTFIEYLEYIRDNHLIVSFGDWFFGKVGVSLFGFSEFSFRFWPFLFSLLSILGMIVFLVRCGTPTGALASAFIVAAGYGFIYHAREFKPYNLDFALMVWSFAAALYWAERPSRLRLATLVLSLVLMALFSLTFAFIYPGIILYYAYRSNNLRNSNLASIAAMLAPTALFLLNVAVIVEYSGATRDFWSEYYLSSLERIPFLISQGARFFERFLGPVWSVAVEFYFIAAIVSLRRKDGVIFLMLPPFVLLVVMSILGLYPLFGRPSFFLYGILALSFGYVVGHILELLPGKPAFLQRRAVREGLSMAMTLGMIAYYIGSGALENNVAAAKRWPMEQGNEAFKVLKEEYRDGDAIKISYGAWYAFLIYQDTVFSGNEGIRAVGERERKKVFDRSAASLCRDLRDNHADIEERTRVWFLTTHVYRGYKHYMEVLSQVGDVRALVAGPVQGLVLLQARRPVGKLDLTRLQCLND